MSHEVVPLPRSATPQALGGGPSLYVGFEDGSRSRCLKRQGRSHALRAHAGEQGRVPTTVTRYRAKGSFFSLGAGTQGREGEMLAPISSTKTSCFESTSSSEINTLQAVLSHSSRFTAPTVRFLAKAHPLQEPLYRREAQRIAGNTLQKQPSVAHGGCGTLLEVFFEQLLDRFVGLGRSPSALPGLEGGSSVGDPGVSLDGGEAHAEEASSC